VLKYGKLSEFTHILTRQAIITRNPFVLKRKRGDCIVYPATMWFATSSRQHLLYKPIINAGGFFRMIANRRMRNTG